MDETLKLDFTPTIILSDITHLGHSTLFKKLSQLSSKIWNYKEVLRSNHVVKVSV